MKERKNAIDVLKGFAIVCVVLGHAIQLYNGTLYREEKIFYANNLYKVIYSFHMPLFMLISGYLFSMSLERNNNFKKILNREISYFIPILTFAIVKTFINTPFNGYFSFLLIKNLFYWIFHTLWFLWALIYATVSVWLFEKITKKYWKIITLFAALILIFITPDVLMSNVFKFTVPFFLVGYYVKKLHLNLSKQIYWISIPIWLLMLCFYDNNHYIYITGVSLNVASANIAEILYQLFFIDVFRYAIGLMGSLAIYKIINEFVLRFSNRFIKCIGMVGRETLGIYIFTTEIINEMVFEVMKNSSYDLIRTIVWSIVVLIGTYLITRLICKMKFLKLVVLGKR